MAFGEKAEQIRGLESQVADLRRELAVAQAAGRVADQAEVIIAQYVDEGQVLAEAETMAVVAITASETATLCNEEKERLLRLKDGELRRKFHRDKGPSVREELDNQFRTDGTYAALEVTVEEEETAAAGEIVLATARAAFTDELRTEEKRAAFLAKAQTTFDASPKAAAIRDEVR